MAPKRKAEELDPSALPFPPTTTPMDDPEGLEDPSEALEPTEAVAPDGELSFLPIPLYFLLDPMY